VVPQKVLVPQSTYIEHHSVCPLVRIGTPPTPLPQASVPYPPDQRVGGHTCLRLRGWGRLRKSLALCLLCDLYFQQTCHWKLPPKILSKPNLVSAHSRQKVVVHVKHVGEQAVGAFISSFKLLHLKEVREEGLTLLTHMDFEIAVLHVMVPQPHRFPLAFLHRYGNLTILEFSSKWVKVMLPYREGGGLPLVGIGGSLMTQSAGSVTTKRKAFKYVPWLLNHTGTRDI
jgi:hypothetical protein